MAIIRFKLQSFMILLTLTGSLVYINCNCAANSHRRVAEKGRLEHYDYSTPQKAFSSFKRAVAEGNKTELEKCFDWASLVEMLGVGPYQYERMSEEERDSSIKLAREKTIDRLLSPEVQKDLLETAFTIIEEEVANNRCRLKVHEIKGEEEQTNWIEFIKIGKEWKIANFIPVKSK